MENSENVILMSENKNRSDRNGNIGNGKYIKHLSKELVIS